MARGEGPGWHHETRRHSEARMKGRTRSYRQKMKRTKPSQYAPCLICGGPTLPERTICYRCEYDQDKNVGEKKGYVSGRERV